VQPWIAADGGSWWALTVLAAVLEAGIATWVVVRAWRRGPAVEETGSPLTG
jgi:hypothetical protein